MEWMHLLQAILSLIFVIGLLLLTLWAFKYCEQKGLKSCFMKKLKSDSRINIIETRRLDAKNSLSLIECDNQSYLILYGGGQTLVLNNQPTTQEVTSND